MARRSLRATTPIQEVETLLYLQQETYLQLLRGAGFGLPKVKSTGIVPDGKRKFFHGSVLVDIESKAVSELYKSVRRESKKQIRNGIDPEMAIISSMVSIVNASMTYKITGKTGTFTTTSIDEYITDGGVCTEFSIAGAAVLQRFRNDGQIDGQIRLVSNLPYGEKVGHAWILYRSSSGTRFILDPTHNKILRYNKKEMAKINPEKDWDYFDSTGKKKPLDNAMASAYPLVTLSLTDLFYMHFLNGGFRIIDYVGSTLGTAVILITARYKRRSSLPKVPEA